MFFVSEEFLRKYEAGEDFGSTLDEVTELGESLFPATQDPDAERLSKAERAEQARRRNDDGGVP
jgi:hypothetical protein